MEGAVIIVGIDPGFASLGLCKVELLPSGAEFPFDVRLVETEKSDKKREVRAADDNVRRARELHAAIVEYLGSDRVVAFCAEAMSFPRSSSVAAKVAMAWGVIASIAEARGIPILQASPQAVKRATTGVKNSSKVDVENALRERYESCDELFELVTKSKREHVVDAVGAVVACLDSDVIRMARQVLKHPATTALSCAHGRLGGHGCPHCMGMAVA
jgi:Holliday junction resolvasome RuvABC endonuclease subunit